MALQGNPFLGKLKIPAPDLSRIPDEPFGTKQTDNKLATNWQQTDNKLATNRQQTDNNPLGENANNLETGNKLATKPTTLSATKWQQTDNKPTTKITFSALVGLQSALIIFLYKSCKAARARCTNALTLEHISTFLGNSTGSVKTTLQRLEMKKYILRVEFKNGRGGWSKYELPDELFRELLQMETENKLATNRQQTGNKVGTKLATKPATSPSSSSSILDLENFKTTTTENAENSNLDSSVLSPEWEQIDIDPLRDIGFTRTHLRQISTQSKITASEVKDSIDYLAFDLKRNNKARAVNGSVLNFFMGILRKGIPYAPPENYESPADEARRKILEFKERKERERAADEQKIFDLELAQWRRGISSDELTKILPEFARKPGPIQESSLKEYFREKIWPDIQAI